MKRGNKNKIILGLALVGALALAGFQTASAGPGGGGTSGWGGAPPCGDCGYRYQGQQIDEETIKARDKFMADTVNIRKDMAVRTAEKRALMMSDNPDAKRVSELTGEIFDLQEQLRTKADESGLKKTDLKGAGFGPSQGMGFGGRQGRGCDGSGPRGYGQNRL